jgi:predicted phage terminase large subunit-like protein
MSQVVIDNEPIISIEEQVADMWGGIAEEEDVDEDLKYDARHDFFSFMKLMHKDYIEGEHLKDLRWHLEEVERGNIKRLIITMPPRHSKSLHVSEDFPAWYLGRHPDRQVVAASHTMLLARKFSRKVRGKMGVPFANPRWPFPGVSVAPGNADTAGWAITGAPEGMPNGYYACVGRGGSPAGQGGDLIIIDDPIRNKEEAESEVIRESLWEWYTDTIYTRRQPGAAIIVTTTRWHEDDLTGRLLETMQQGGEKWVHLHMPALDENTGEYLWPEFWTEEEYELVKQMPGGVWQSQYQGTPTAKEGALLKRHWFPYAPHGERYLSIVQSWDTAQKPGVTNDWSVCATIGVSPTSYDIIDIWREQVEYPDLLQAAKDRATWAKMAFMGIPYTMLVEDKASGISLIQSLHAETSLPVIPIPAVQKDQKEQRVIDVTPLAKSHRIRLLENAPWLQALLREFGQFPHGAHDDIVDAAMIGVRYASGIGVMKPATSKSYIQRDESDENDRGEMTKRTRPKPPPPRKPPKRGYR